MRQPKEAFLKACLINNGLGPAQIKSFRIFFDKKPLAGDWRSSTEKILNNHFTPGKYNFQSLMLAENYVMSDKESRAFLTLHFPCDTDEELVAAEKYLNRIDVLIKYESMYGEKFLFDSRDNEH
jgi:hypothetical protein